MNTEEEVSRFSDQNHNDTHMFMMSEKIESEMVDHILQLVEEIDVEYLPDNQIDFTKITVNKLRYERSLEEKQAILRELESLKSNRSVQ